MVPAMPGRAGAELVYNRLPGLLGKPAPYGLNFEQAGARNNRLSTAPDSSP